MRKLAHPNLGFRYWLLALSVLWAVQAISQESAPNLSGIWRWNPDKSHVGGRPVANRRVKIEQQGSDLTMTTRIETKAGEEFQKSHFTIGSDENINQVMDSNVKSKVQWKDGALAVDSVTNMGQGEQHANDTWTLSADGQTLAFHESRVMGNGTTNESTIVYEKQPEADWEAPHPAKPAEEVYKNIQVFKGMPATDVMVAMRSFTRALGVHCEFCHDEKAFESDDLHPKLAARKMILMARQINTDNFHGHMRVTCWTCHRGATEPESAPK
jgi:hypothetical protein